MSKRTASQMLTVNGQQTKANGHASFCIDGVLDHVYTGKKYNYAYIKVTKDNGYYDMYKVQCDLDYDFPDDGQNITISGSMSQFKNEITFVSND